MHGRRDLYATLRGALPSGRDHLNPDAPVKVAPFTPPLLGTKQIANFTSTSLPQLGTLFVGVFATFTALLLAWHVFAGRRAAVRAEATAGAPLAENA